jgi:hypothetical protein
MKKTILLALVALNLSGCAVVDEVVRRGAFPAAGGIETHVGAECIRAQERGQAPSRVPIFTARQAREMFNARFGPRLTVAEMDALNRIRANTDGVCPGLVAPATVPGE